MSSHFASPATSTIMTQSMMEKSPQLNTLAVELQPTPQISSENERSLNELRESLKVFNEIRQRKPHFGQESIIIEDGSDQWFSVLSWLMETAQIAMNKIELLGKQENQELSVITDHFSSSSKKLLKEENGALKTLLNTMQTKLNDMTIRLKQADLTWQGKLKDSETNVTRFQEDHDIILAELQKQIREMSMRHSCVVEDHKKELHMQKNRTVELEFLLQQWKRDCNDQDEKIKHLNALLNMNKDRKLIAEQELKLLKVNQAMQAERDRITSIEERKEFIEKISDLESECDSLSEDHAEISIKLLEERKMTKDLKEKLSQIHESSRLYLGSEQLPCLDIQTSPKVQSTQASPFVMVAKSYCEAQKHIPEPDCDLNIDLVLQQVKASRTYAAETLRKTKGDIVKAILDLADQGAPSAIEPVAINSDDVDVVVQQAKVSRSAALFALQQTSSDIVEAILKLTT
jgi:NACalpha-BTF3-like transcription factor